MKGNALEETGGKKGVGCCNLEGKADTDKLHRLLSKKICLAKEAIY